MPTIIVSPQGLSQRTLRTSAIFVSPQGLSQRTLRTSAILERKYYSAYGDYANHNYDIYKMAIRTNHKITHNTWFITFTCFNWISLFEITQSYDLVYKWLKLADEKYKIKTLAFVIMPNHVHLLLYLTDHQVNLNTVVSNAKRFMAYDFIARLKEQDNQTILNTLSTGCSEKARAKGQLHKAFEVSFDAKVVYSIDFLYQKLDYIHHNPVSGKWNLCNEFTDYVHSSAAYYELAQPHPHINIVHYIEYWV